MEIVKNKLSGNDLKAAISLKKEAKKALGSNFRVIFAYGSRVEGTAKKDSDLDLFLLTNKKPKLNSRESEKLNRISINILNTYGVYPSIVVYGEKEYKEFENTPYLYWLKKTGVSL